MTVYRIAASALVIVLVSGATVHSPNAVASEPQRSEGEVIIEPVAPETVRPGEEFDVIVLAREVQSMAGIQFVLNYDTYVLDFLDAKSLLDSVVPSDGAPPCAAAFYNHKTDPPEDGFVSTAIACEVGMSGASLDLWLLTFMVHEDAGSQETRIAVKDLAVGDDQSPPERIPAFGEEDIITIMEGVCGDQDGNNRVNILDAIIDMKIIVGLIDATPLQMILSDLDGNGDIDVVDVIALLQNIVGIAPITGCGPRQTFTEEDDFRLSEGELMLILPDQSELFIQLAGQSTINVFFEGPNEGDANDDTNNGRDEVNTELRGEVTGDSPLGPISVRINPQGDPNGWIEEHTNGVLGTLDLPPFAEGLADSFFDVFVDIEIDGQVHHNSDPMRVDGVISHKPPAPGESYYGSDLVPLFDSDQNPTGFAVGMLRYTPNPITGPASIHGVKYFDFDRNGRWGEGEPGLTGWKIYLDMDDNGVWGEGEPWTETNDEGWYQFMDLQHGDYTVREEVQNGWIQTGPMMWIALLQGENMVPPVGTEARGSLKMNLFGTEAVLRAGWRDLHGDATEVLIHQDLPEPENDPVVYDLGQMVGSLESPIEVAFNFDPDFLDELGNGELYVSVHSENFPGGEILGDILPSDGALHVTLEAGQERILHFGNYGENLPSGSIHGAKFLDLNRNGFTDGDEPGLEGWQVYLDDNNNGTWDDGEAGMLTDQNGEFSFMDLVPGRYVVREVLRDGWPQTGPPMFAAHDLRGEQQVPPVETGGHGWFGFNLDESTNKMTYFGEWWELQGEVQQVHIHLGEEGVNGPEVYDLGDMKELGVPIPSKFDIDPGLMDDLVNGRLYVDIHSEAFPDGEIRSQIWPSDRGFHLTLLPEQEHQIQFGNISEDLPPGSIHGFKFLDLNRNGIPDGDEPGAQGWTVYLDLNDNQVWDDGEPSMETNEHGEFWFMDLAPNVYSVREVLQDGWIQTLPSMYNVGGLHGDREVPPVQTDAQGWFRFNLNEATNEMAFYGEWWNLQGNTTAVLIHQGAEGENGPVVYDLGAISGIQAPSIGVFAFDPALLDDLNNGRLYVNVHSDAFPGGEIRNQIWPGGTGYYVPVLPEQEQYVEFGNITDDLPPGSIGGSKYLDLNRNGFTDPDEPGLEGWQIYLDENKNGAWDNGEPGSVTDQNGEFLFPDVPPGTHVVREVLQDGWTQTEPSMFTTWGMNGWQEVPPVQTDASGWFRFNLNEVTNEVSFSGDWWDLQGTATAVHIHQAAEGENGPVVLDLGLIAGLNPIITGTFNLDPVLMHDLMNGGLYVNLHTTAFPDGEIRQQIWQRSDSYEITLLPEQEYRVHFGNITDDLPPGSIGGSKYLDLNRNGFTDPDEPGLEGWQIYLDENKNGAWDNGEPGSVTDQNGEFLFPDVPPGTHVVREVLQDGWTQTEPSMFTTWGMNGWQEVPPIQTDASGWFRFNLNEVTNEVSFSGDWWDLQGNPTSVQIHQGAEGSNGPVVYDLGAIGGLNPIITGTFNLDPVLMRDLMNGGLYVNLHTTAFPDGEIRQQIWQRSDSYEITLLPEQEYRVHFGNVTDGLPVGL